MKLPRKFSLRTSLALLVAGTAFATMPRYNVYPLVTHIGHDSQPTGIAVRKNELVYVPLIKGFEFRNTFVGAWGPEMYIQTECPFTEYTSYDGNTCARILQSGVTFGGAQLRSVCYSTRGHTPEETAACKAADALIQEFAAKLEIQ